MSDVFKATLKVHFGLMIKISFQSSRNRVSKSRLRLLGSVIGQQNSHLFNQWDANPKPIATSMSGHARIFPRFAPAFWLAHSVVCVCWKWSESITNRSIKLKNLNLCTVITRVLYVRFSTVCLWNYFEKARNFHRLNSVLKSWNQLLIGPGDLNIFSKQVSNFSVSL